MSEISDDAQVKVIAKALSHRILALMVASAGTPAQGLLLNRIRTALDEMGKDFPPDRATLEKWRPEIERLTANYYAIIEAIGAAELEHLWGDTPETCQRHITEMREELKQHRAKYTFDAWVERLTGTKNS